MWRAWDCCSEGVLWGLKHRLLQIPCDNLIIAGIRVFDGSSVHLISYPCDLGMYLHGYPNEVSVAQRRRHVHGRHLIWLSLMV